MQSKPVAGRYRVVRELGRDGAGVVWSAEDRVGGRWVALRELRTSSPAELERVLRDVRAVGRLGSPAVVAVHDVLVEHGVGYVVTEPVEAPTLADLVRGGPLPVERVVAIGAQVLAALEAAHAAGVVHRDVKPANVVVLPDGRVEVTGFGLPGSPGLPAPELLAGQAPSPAADLWSLGATLFHAVEGRPPARRGAPVLDRCTGALAGVVAGLLAQSPANRPTAAQARERLRVVEPETVVIPRRQPGGDKDEDRRRVALLVGSAVVVLAAVLISAFLLVPDAEPGRASGERSQVAPSPTTTPAANTATTTTTQEVVPPPVTTTPTTPQRQTAALTRFRNAEGRHYTGSTMLVTPDGFVPEGPMGKLVINAEPDTTPLYSCEVKNSSDRMTSPSAVCEGQTAYGLLGHVFTKQPADAAAVPLYRCNAGGHHFDSLDPACEGRPVEFQLGWVLA